MRSWYSVSQLLYYSKYMPQPFENTMLLLFRHVVARLLFVVAGMADPRYTGQSGIVLLEEPEEKFRFRYKSGMTTLNTLLHSPRFFPRSRHFM